MKQFSENSERLNQTGFHLTKKQRELLVIMLLKEIEKSKGDKLKLVREILIKL